jgi:hypothetical protein
LEDNVHVGGGDLGIQLLVGKVEIDDSKDLGVDVSITIAVDLKDVGMGRHGLE